MELSTKYNVGDKIWFAEFNKFYIGTIVSVNNWSANNGFAYGVELDNNDNHAQHIIYEKDIYPTKQDILNEVFMSEGDITTFAPTLNEAPAEDSVIINEAPATTAAPKTKKTK